eukprot:TRINITY_DN5549_c0_g1_i1.p1 TRINITY_DN5549_c0_g1~~TRINITY_DN5549_c0_g1_i1.p1  ORF type:complete len:437 (+),score=118.00 TRINITY_DN5549_c0_g1_i1:42-1352(+)
MLHSRALSALLFVCCACAVADAWRLQSSFRPSSADDGDAFGSLCSIQFNYKNDTERLAVVYRDSVVALYGAPTQGAYYTKYYKRDLAQDPVKRDGLKVMQVAMSEYHLVTVCKCNASSLLFAQLWDHPENTSEVALDAVADVTGGSLTALDDHKKKDSTVLAGFPDGLAGSLGVVNVYYANSGTTNYVLKSQLHPQLNATATDQFGASVTLVKNGDDGKIYFAVGAPGADNGGCVDLYSSPNVTSSVQYMRTVCGNDVQQGTKNFGSFLLWTHDSKHLFVTATDANGNALVLALEIDVSKTPATFDLEDTFLFSVPTVSIAVDYPMLAIGVPSATDTNYAYVYTRDGGKWHRTDKVSHGKGNGFGAYVALRENVLLVSEPQYKDASGKITVISLLALDDVTSSIVFAAVVGFALLVPAVVIGLWFLRKPVVASDVA